MRPSWIANERMTAFLAVMHAGDEERIVVIDSGSLLSCSETVSLAAAHAGQILMVTAKGQTKRVDVEEALGILHRQAGMVDETRGGAGLQQDRPLPITRPIFAPALTGHGVDLVSLEILRGPSPDRRRWMGATFGGAAYALACGEKSASQPEPIEPYVRETKPMLGTGGRGASHPHEHQPPYISMQEIYTDNVDLSPDGARSDFITRGVAGLQANLAAGRLTGALEAEYAYDWYARSGKFSGGSVSAQGTGDYSLIPKRLWIEADGSIGDGYPSTFRTPAIDRAGAAGRTRIGIFRVGPRMQAPVDGFAELEAVVRYERVDYLLQPERRQPAPTTAKRRHRPGARAAEHRRTLDPRLRTDNDRRVRP